VIAGNGDPAQGCRGRRPASVFGARLIGGRVLEWLRSDPTGRFYRARCSAQAFELLENAVVGSRFAWSKSPPTTKRDRCPPDRSATAPRFF